VRIIIECPERILHLEAGYIYADCTFAQLQTSCSSVADHTLSVIESRVENRRSGVSLPVAADEAFASSPQSGLAWFCFLFPLIGRVGSRRAL